MQSGIYMATYPWDSQMMKCTLLKILSIFGILEGSRFVFGTKIVSNLLDDGVYGMHWEGRRN
jgi:hypothetical protein